VVAIESTSFFGGFMKDARNSEFYGLFAPPADRDEAIDRIAELTVDIEKLTFLLGDEYKRLSLTEREYSSWRRRALYERARFQYERSFLNSHLRTCENNVIAEKIETLRCEIAHRRAYAEECEARNREVRALIEASDLSLPVRLLDKLNRLVQGQSMRVGWELREEDRFVLLEVRDFLQTTGNWSPPFHLQPGDQSHGPVAIR
jgi:hypothetical protein